METLFTPFASLGGGALIGLGAALLILGLGRIFGATGIMSSLVFGVGIALASMMNPAKFSTSSTSRARGTQALPL